LFARTVERDVFQESVLYTCLSSWEKPTSKSQPLDGVSAVPEESCCRR